jgi:hypothetical protein
VQVKYIRKPENSEIYIIMILVLYRKKEPSEKKKPEL